VSRRPADLAAIVVMGVTGSGKSSLARPLARRLGWPFVEGDDLHPDANVAKMRGGAPLDDADRAPWLAAIAARIDGWRLAGRRGVVTCSALKRAYRARLAGDAGDVRFVYLTGDEALLAERLGRRTGHFMPPALLASQLSTLEPPTPDEAAIVVDIALPLEAQLSLVLDALGLA
jgi:carbohydrate kinase (thermoresistant glucokinase family)